MQSFRYVDKNDFTYVIPKNIEKFEDVKLVYEDVMSFIDAKRKEIRDYVYWRQK